MEKRAGARARADGTGAIHVVRAWASRKELVLAPFHVDDKRHERTARPELLARLNLHGSVVTIDARGCQVEIARQMVDHGGDDGLSWKAHQPRVPRAGEELFAWLRGPHPRAQAVGLGDEAQVDGGHGRIETRTVWRTETREGLGACERWPGLTTVVLGESTRQVSDHESVARRSDLSSLPGTTDDEAKRLSGGMRTHGAIATRGHGVLDVAMGEDTHRTRAGESAQNLA